MHDCEHNSGYLGTPANRENGRLIRIREAKLVNRPP